MRTLGSWTSTDSASWGGGDAAWGHWVHGPPLIPHPGGDAAWGHWAHESPLTSLFLTLSILGGMLRGDTGPMDLH